MEVYEPLSRQVENIYRKYLLSPAHEAEENEQKLYNKAHDLLLLIIGTSLRHRKMSLEIIQSSVENLDNFDAKNAAKAFRMLEQYSKNLVHFPWKSGYKKIKAYSGVIRLKIDNWIRGYKLVFEGLGYVKHSNEFILERNVSREERELIALDCFVASVEMDIYREIYHRVSPRGYTYLDVHKARQHCNEDINGCEKWILRHCTPQETIRILDERLNAVKNPAAAKPRTNTIPDSVDPMHFDVLHHNYDITQLSTQTIKSITQDVSDEHKMKFPNKDEFNIIGSYNKNKKLMREEEKARNFRHDHPMEIDSYNTVSAAARIKTIALDADKYGDKPMPAVQLGVFPTGADAMASDSGASNENSYVPGTIEDHVKESMKLLEEEANKPLPAVSPPSYKSMYPNAKQKYDEEWGDVRKTIQNMGERFADPGGRGDILRGDRMVPSDVPRNNKDNTELPLEPIYSELPPPPEHQNDPLNEAAVDLPLPPPPENIDADLYSSNMNHYQSCGAATQPLYNIIKDSRRGLLVTDGPETDCDEHLLSVNKPSKRSSPNLPVRSSSNHNAVRQNLLSKIPSSTAEATTTDLFLEHSGRSADTVIQTSRTKNRGHLLQSPQQQISPPFTTFKGGGGSGSKSPGSATAMSPILNRPMERNMHRLDEYSCVEQADGTEDINNDPAANDVYVSLRRTADGTIDYSSLVNDNGKPSYQQNFQRTTQRFYDSGSGFQSLPPVKTAQPITEKDRKNLLIKRSGSVQEDTWQCDKCTFANHAQISVCEMCGTSREVDKQRPLQTGGSQCNKCTVVNEEGAEKCQVCQTPLKGSPTYI